MKQTRYEKELGRLLAERYQGMGVAEVVEQLCLIGVVDHTMCKVMAVRRWVEDEVKEGRGKGEAMWMAAEYFCATYEYVRKCMYYYTDVNL